MCCTRKQRAGFAQCKKEGNRSSYNFCQPPSVSLTQLSKLKLDNFSNVKKSSLLSKEGKSVILRADGNLFARLLVIGQSQKVDL